MKSSFLSILIVLMMLFFISPFLIPGMEPVNAVDFNKSTVLLDNPQTILDKAELYRSSYPSIWDRFSTNFRKDPIANSLAVVVLAGMLVSVVAVLIIIIRGFFTENPSPSNTHISNKIIPILVLIGLGIASYLSFLEVSKQPAICGPVGNCNQVQNSPYAKLFGVLPVGILGLIGYAAMLIAWGIRIIGPKGLHQFSIVSLWGLSLFGIVFSIYLTFLEPFLIGTTCMWCLSSALDMTALFWVSTPGMQALLPIEDDEEVQDELTVESD
jgi:uncharacterized membrane protein